jgi:hypothetical protein
LWLMHGFTSTLAATRTCPRSQQGTGFS